VVAIVLLGSGVLLAFWELRLAIATYAPTPKFVVFFALRFSIPLVLIILGLTAFGRIRSIDSQTFICIAGILFTIIFAVGGLFVLVTGYNFSKYYPGSVPRVQSIAYFAASIIALAVTATTVRLNKKRRAKVA
jgi:hypothetical protein